MTDISIEKIGFDLVTEKERIVFKEIVLKSYMQYESFFSEEKWSNYLKELEGVTTHAGTDYFIIAKLNEKTVATLQVYQNGEAAYDERAPKIDYPVIRFLAVDPEARGKGIAKQLLDHAIVYGKSLRSKKILLHTMEMMPDAARLYERYGFNRNEQYDYYKDGLIIKSYTFDLN